MATKFPRKVVFIVFPYGIVDPKRPNIHFSFEDQKLIVDEINAHRKTTYYLKRNRKKHLLTVEGNRVLVNGKDFSQESISINTIAEEKRTIIFGSFPYGYANLANPSRHYTEQEIKDMISFYPQKKYFLHDRNTYLTYNLSKRQLVTINRPLRRFSLWVALVSLCVIVPFFTSVGLLSAAVNTLSYQYKGKRPGSFDSGFSMALWYHNRGRLFMSRNKFSFNVFDNKFQDNDTYLNALKKVTDDDLYTLMIGTFLYSPLSTKAPTDNNYYLPMQQSKDSEGNLTNDGYWSRIVSPIYNLYAHDLEVVVAKSDTFDTDGAFFFSLHYVYDWANIRNQSATYKAIFSGHAKLDNSFAKNFAHTNNNLWNWGISSTDVKLSWETVSGDGATLKETAFGNSNAAWCWENDASGDNNPDSDNPRLPSVINTDPYLDNWIVRTPQVFIYWVINGQKDDNNKR